MLELTSVAGFAAGKPGAISAAKSGISEAKSSAIACASEKGSKGMSTYAESRKPARGNTLRCAVGRVPVLLKSDLAKHKELQSVPTSDRARYQNGCSPRRNRFTIVVEW